MRTRGANEESPDSQHQSLANKRGLFLALQAWARGERNPPTHKATLPGAQGVLCKTRLQEGSAQEGPTFTSSLPRPSQSTCRSSP